MWIPFLPNVSMSQLYQMWKGEGKALPFHMDTSYEKALKKTINVLVPQGLEMYKPC